MSKEKSGKLKSDKTAPAKTPKEKKAEKLFYYESSDKVSNGGHKLEKDFF